MDNLSAHIRPVQLLAPHTLTATTTTLVLDRYGWDCVVFLLDLGAAAGTLDADNKVAVAVKGSDTTDAADFEALDGDDELFLYGPSDIDGSADDERIQRIEYIGDQRYLCLTLTVTGSVSLPLAVLALLGGPSQAIAGAPDVGIAAT